MEAAKVAIIGFGTIGSGVARLLLEHGDRIARHAGKRLELACIVDPDLKRPRNFALPPGLLTADLARVTSAPEIVAAIELVGGLEPARTTERAYAEFDDDVFRTLYYRPLADGTTTAEFYLEGVHCAACVWLVEKLPQVLPGVPGIQR